MVERNEENDENDEVIKRRSTYTSAGEKRCCSNLSPKGSVRTENGKGIKLAGVQILSGTHLLLGRFLTAIRSCRGDYLIQLSAV